MSQISVTSPLNAQIKCLIDPPHLDGREQNNEEHNSSVSELHLNDYKNKIK